MRRAALAAVLTIATSHAYATCNTAAPQLCDPTQMQVIDLGAGPNGTGTQARAVNASGEVVGSFADNSGGWHPFSWTQAGGIVALPEPAGALYTYASAINARGHIVGDASFNVNGKTVSHAILWSGGKVQSLGLGSAVDINDSGAILGFRGAGWGQPTVWTAFVAKSLPLNVAEKVLAFNNGGEIVGYTVGNTSGGSFVLMPGATAPTFMATRGYLYGINTKGEAVGDNGAKHNVSVLRYVNGVTRSFPGVAGADSRGCSVNTAGMISGYYETPTTNGAFLMEPTGAVYDLSALYGLGIGCAPHTINASGWISGTTYTAGVLHAELLVWK